MGVHVHELGANEPTCTPLATPLSVSYLSKVVMMIRNLLLCSYSLETYNFLQGFYEDIQGFYESIILNFRTLVWTNEITVQWYKKMFVVGG